MDQEGGGRQDPQTCREVGKTRERAGVGLGGFRRGAQVSEGRGGHETRLLTEESACSTGSRGGQEAGGRKRSRVKGRLFFFQCISNYEIF